ncbi:MAG: hypothetical protein LBC10_05575 [Deltaproteobacteria bacterium]|jgi:electron transfer flavoprotein beta subunit|nr:hypothetical protein [Deltaproteobacteria bacterium]
MAVYVCLKQIPNIEGIPAVRPESGFLAADAWLMNPLDGYALQEALRAARSLGQPCVAVSAGGQEAVQGLRLALALGAERAACIGPVPALAGPAMTAAYLTAGICLDAAEQDEALTLVFCGRQAADTAGMQTPYRLAGLLGCEAVSDVSAWSLCPERGIVRLIRQWGGFRQGVEADLPCVLAVNRGLQDLPRPSLPGVIRAKKAPIRRLPAEEAARTLRTLRPEALHALEMREPVLTRLAEPEASAPVRMAQGRTTEEKVRHLIAMLREESIL